MHCVARVSIKFKAIFRAHRSSLIVIDHHHQWTLNEEVIIHWWTLVVWEVIVDGRNGDIREWGRAGSLSQRIQRRIIHSF